MKNLRKSLLGISRNAILTIIGISTVLFLMLFRLVTITPGVSSKEVAVYNSANSANVIIENMVNAPYKAAMFASTKVFEPYFGLRFVGAIIGAIIVILFFLLIRYLYGNIIGLATTAMFATSSLFLGMSRTATPNIMLLSVLAITSIGFYIRFGKKPEKAWIIGAFIIGLSLYVPGVILYIIPAIIWQFKHIKTSLEKLSTVMIVVVSLIFGILVTPLLFSIVQNPSIILGYIGINTPLEPILTMAKYAGVSIVSMFVRSPMDHAYWLGRQPILDIFATAMFTCGAYSYIKKYRLHRLWLVLGVAVLSIIWIGITTNRYSIIILLPFVYIVIGGGLRMMTDRWFEIFPKNPIAKYIGVSLLTIAIAISINFQLQRYFIAWPHHQPTIDAFSEQLPTTSEGK